MSALLWAALLGCGTQGSVETPVPMGDAVHPPVAAEADAPSPETAPGTAAETVPQRVWLDVDVSAGLPAKDVDDAVALVQAFHSAELDVVGVSSVFGNAPLEVADPLAREVVALLDPSMQVARGAAQPGAGDAPTQAVEAMATALEDGPLVARSWFGPGRPLVGW